MNSDESLKQILDAVYDMALRKKEKNKKRKNGEKYAEIVRVRLGTRIPVYLPQRITDNLVAILADFRKKATGIGIQQFIIQTHIQSAMEITPETREGIQKLIRAGWLVTNQQVFITAASLRGHTAKLRKVLNDIGVLPYYTFSVKGFMENHSNFTTNARSVQELTEEKCFGKVPVTQLKELQNIREKAVDAPEIINALRKKEGLPFLATDRNVMNLPGLGKSLKFRTIGITRDGRRILRFKHDESRHHSPIVRKTGDIFIIESKSVAKYLKQIESMGQNTREYQTIWGYSLNETESRSPVYLYPEYAFDVTDKYTNLQLDDSVSKEEISQEVSVN
jgi:lysine 2,3-aminomutase